MTDGEAAWSRDSSAASISSSNGSTTSSSRLASVEVGILVGLVAGRGDGLERGRLVQLLNLRQEVRRLPELDRVAVAVEEALEERLLRADQGGDPRFDSLLADEVVDVDRQLLAQAVDAADPLLEHGRVPGELEVDHAVGGALQVEPDAAGIAGEEHAKVGVVVELDDVLGPPPLSLGSGEEARAEALLGQQVAHRPVGQGEHPPPLAEDDDLAALLEHDLPDELAQLEQLGRGQALEHALLGSAVADRRPDVLELKLSQAVGDDPLSGQADSSSGGTRPGSAAA